MFRRLLASDLTAREGRQVPIHDLWTVFREADPSAITEIPPDDRPPRRGGCDARGRREGAGCWADHDANATDHG
jgi:hypothetical protein